MRNPHTPVEKEDARVLLRQQSDMLRDSTRLPNWELGENKRQKPDTKHNVLPKF